MGFDPGLKIGDVITNHELGTIFKCGNSGGMRKSNTRKSLVIVNDQTKGLYENRWEGDILHYTGMGRSGDQSLHYQQNATLNESNTNGVKLFLFEVVKATEYTYLGPVVLHAMPYQERQPDQDDQIRNVWIFPLKLNHSEEASSIFGNLIEQKFIEKEKKVRRLSTEELKEKAKQTNSKKVAKRNVTVTAHERNSYVVEYAKRRANGVCELCEIEAPFLNKNNEPYLETHHIEWLANGGEDTIENTVALCPNCHTKMHIVDAQEDVEKLRQIVKEF